MALTRSQVSLIHVAKTRLKLSDDDYRDIIRHVGGAEHANELDQLGFDDVMDYFRQLGFESDFHRTTSCDRRAFSAVWRAMPFARHQAARVVPRRTNSARTAL